MTLTPSAVLAIATSQIGTKESPAGSNDQKYGLALGLNGAPWCALFVWWVLSQAGTDIRTSIGPTLTPEEVSYCPALLNAFRQAGRLHQWPDVQEGDVAFYCFQGTAAEHVGIIESFNLDLGYVVDIEGNTAVGNDANGGEVLRRQRDHRIILGFGRLPYDEDDDLTPEQAAQLQAVTDAVGRIEIAVRDPKTGLLPEVEKLVAEEAVPAAAPEASAS